MGSLDGLVAIVTGAGRGLGRSHALHLAQEGAAVVVNDPGVGGGGEGDGDATPAAQVVAEIEAAGGRAVANLDSCADWKAAEGMVAQAVETFGKLDILVNNAGILRDRMSFKMSEDEWDSVMTVHLKGHFAPSRFAAAYWRDRAKAGEGEVYGRIINTSSESGYFGNVGQVNYATVKAGIVGMTMTMARELESIGVTVNAIAPRARTVRRLPDRRGREVRHSRSREHQSGGRLARRPRGRPHLRQGLRLLRRGRGPADADRGRDAPVGG
jgi:NAD(P)-dependent dehydrogenase (short-subunit alcohol dehydrogenase family)